MLLAAAHANNGVGENGGVSEFVGTIDDLVGTLSIDECFRDEEARTEGAGSSFRGDGHSRNIPFIKQYGGTGNTASQQDTPDKATHERFAYMVS